MALALPASIMGNMCLYGYLRKSVYNEALAPLFIMDGKLARVDRELGQYSTSCSVVQ